MATLSHIPEPAAYVVRQVQALPAYGIGGSGWPMAGLHGRDLAALFSTVHQVHQNYAETGNAIASADAIEDFSYRSVPPVRSYTATVTFVRGGRIAPMPLAFDPDDE